MKCINCTDTSEYAFTLYRAHTREHYYVCTRTHCQFVQVEIEDTRTPGQLAAF